jgi:hypothetical protein
VCAKTRRQTTTPDGTPGFLCLRNPTLAGAKRPFFFCSIAIAYASLVSVSSRSGRIRKFLPQLYVCAFRLVSMVRIWCTRSLGRLNLLDILLRHNALVGRHPGPRKNSR